MTEEYIADSFNRGPSSKKKDHYRDNSNLKQVGVDIQYTQEQVDEYIKCSKNPLYFIKKHYKINTLDGGVVQFRPHPFQEKLIKLMHKERWLITKCPRQVGKCFFGETNLKIRNKKTGEIMEISANDFYSKMKEKDTKNI